MSEAKFTKGPWGNDRSIKVRGLNFLSHCHYETEEGRANALLIAAAPELYEALQIARDYVAAELEDERQAYKGYEASSNIMTIEEDLNRADAALAKARGEL